MHAHISKNHFDKAYNAKMEKLKKWTPDSKYKNSPMHNQTSFSKMDTQLHFTTTFFIMLTLFWLIGFKLQVLVFLIKYAPFPFMDTLGHGPKCLFYCGVMGNIALIGALFVKYLFYQVVGFVYGLEHLQATDDLYLFDSPVNPINIPGYVVFKKEKGKVDDWDKVFDTFISRYDRDPKCRNFLKVEKKFGKYFLKKQTKEEWDEVSKY